MKAYILNRYSKNETLKLSEIACPVITENQVLVEIHSAGINQLDAKLASAEFKLILPYKLPLVLGHDLAGVVKEVGSKVSKFKVGDEVYARVRDFQIGTFAEFIAVNENDLAIKPKNISMDDAASLPLVALTVWQALVEKAKLQSGQKVFIQAGSGGVGTIAIQLAKYLGATIATTTSANNFELVKSLGADVIIDYKKDDFEKILSDYDLVLNSQDEKTLEKLLRILKISGKVISISGPPDKDFAEQLNLSWFMRTVIQLLNRKVRKQAKKFEIDYSFLFMTASGEQLAELTKLVENNTIKPVVDKVYKFEELNEAMKYVASGRAKGKVVVSVRGSTQRA